MRKEPPQILRAVTAAADVNLLHAAASYIMAAPNLFREPEMS
jgi:hypothetical protein